MIKITQNFEGNHRYISVKKPFTQKILSFLKNDKVNKLGIIRDKERLIIKNENTDYHLIPISKKTETLTDFDLKKLSEALNVQGVPCEFFTKKHIHPDQIRQTYSERLKELIKKKIPSDLYEYIPNRFDVIGTIAITEIDRWNEMNVFFTKHPEIMNLNLKSFKKMVGDTILTVHRNVKTVLNKRGSVKGEFRIREFELISGEQNTETLYKENNCTFLMDVSQMFFSPRLVFERNRISNLIFKEGDIILDAFAGIGPFSIQIAKKNCVKVYCCEKNQNAYRYLIKNIKLNQVLNSSSIFPYQGDFRNFKYSRKAEDLYNKVNYILMNLPEKNLEFISDIKPFVRPNGTILIIYLFAPKINPFKTVISKLKSALERKEMKLMRIINKRLVNKYSPQMLKVVLDVLILKN